MTKLPIFRSGDRKAMLVATLCFIHCVAGPVLLTFAGFSSLTAASESFEPVFLISSALLGSATLIPAYRRKHRRCSCLVLFICGLFCLVGDCAGRRPGRRWRVPDRRCARDEPEVPEVV